MNFPYSRKKIIERNEYFVSRIVLIERFYRNANAFSNNLEQLTSQLIIQTLDRTRGSRNLLKYSISFAGRRGLIFGLKKKKLNPRSKDRKRRKSGKVICVVANSFIILTGATLTPRVRGLVNLYSLSRVETKTRAYTAFARIKDKWFGKESPSLKVALSMRKCIYAKTRAEEIEKKRERRDWAEGKRKTPSLLSPNCDRSKDETRRKIRQRKKKNARVTKQIDEIVHRSLNGEREREKTWLGRSYT